MKYTDPSGFFFKKIFRAIKRAVKAVKKYIKVIIVIVVAVVIAMYVGPAISKMVMSWGGAFVNTGYLIGVGFVPLSLSVTGAIVAGAITGAIVGFATGMVGSLLSGGAAGGIGQAFGHSTSFLNGGENALIKAVSHGISRAAITKAQGGRWSSGFWSGFVASGFAAGKSFGKELGTVITSITSGLTSKITGGKFANGAVTGAFVHIFNRYAGFSNDVNGQDERINELSTEYQYSNFKSKEFTIGDLLLNAGTSAASGYAAAVKKFKNVWSGIAGALAGAGTSIKKDFMIEAVDGRNSYQKLKYDFVKRNINNPYTNPAANPRYF